MKPPGATLPPAGSDETIAGTGGVAPRRNQALRPGEMVGRYVVLELLGRGAMGVVYKAIDPKLDRAVAVKLLLGDANEAGRQRLMREAQSIAKVSHPNVIAVHDVGTHEGRVFFAMELVDGLPLRRWLASSSPGIERVLDVFRQAGAGLAAAHAAGLIHRDFKPDNVLVDGTGRVRVLDFGLARHGDEQPMDLDDQGSVDDVHLTRTGAVMGTPAYMAPELFSGEQADPRSDQFAFCVALHEALTGERPYAGNTLAVLSRAVVRGDRREVQFTGVSSKVVSAIERGLSHDPSERFASMDALLAELAPRTSPRWGRLGLAGAALLAVATGTAYGIGRERGAAPPPDPCRGAGEVIDTRWNPERRLDVTTAFAASGAPNADFMSQRVADALDAYAARWRAIAEESCRLTRVDRSLGTEMAFRSANCVSSALEDFAEQLDALTTVDDDAVQDALSDVERLVYPEDCVDPRRLELRVMVPSDPELRRGVEALGPSFDEAKAHSRASEPRACLRVIADVERRARALGHGPSVARALDIRGGCESAAGMHEASVKTQQLTFEEALASGHDELAIAVAAETAQRVASRTEDFELAETWVRRAEAIARRHDLEDSRSVRVVFNARGVLAALEGRPRESVRWFQKLVDATRDSPDGSLTHLAALQNIGVTLANAGQPEDALQSFQEAVSFSEAHWGPDHPGVAAAQAKLAQGLLRLNRVDEARAPQLAALEVLRRTQPESMNIANSLFAMALIELRLDRQKEALAYGREAYATHVRLGAVAATSTAELLNTLSALEREHGSLETAEDLARESLELREGRGEPLETAESLLLLASVYIERKELSEARRLIQRAEGLASNADVGTFRARRGPVLYRIAKGTLDIGNEARAMQLFARAEAFTTEDSDQASTNLLRLAYARVLAEKGELERAKALLQRIEKTNELYPYPPSIVEDTRALREELGS